jgi:UDP-glucose 4-epimerase
MKVLVTGGAGFIGLPTLALLLQAGHDVVVVDDLSAGTPAWIPAEARLIVASVCDADQVEMLLMAERPDVVLHLAALVNVRESVRKPGLYTDVNVTGTENVLRAAVRAGARRFVFASSGGAVYGEPDSLPIPETHRLQPISPYGRTKAMAEDLLSRCDGQMEGISLRYGNVYGPGQDSSRGNGVVSIFLDSLRRGQRPEVFGDGGQVRDYVFVGDVARANQTAVEAKAIGVFNIGTGTGHTVKQICRKVADMLNSPLEPVHQPANTFEVRRSVLDVARARTVLGWAATVSLDRGLRLTLRQPKASPDATVVPSDTLPLPSQE